MKLLRTFGPKVLLIATSAASRPCAISTRPMRGMLLRGSKVPLPVEIGFEPAREIHRAVRWCHADITKVAGAIARRDVHAATEGDRQVREVATYSGAVVVGVPRGLGRPACS